MDGEENESGEEDAVEERGEDSESEQDLDPEDRLDVSGTHSCNFYFGKDKTKWNVHSPPRNTRTRARNLVTQLPGPKLPV